MISFELSPVEGFPKYTLAVKGSTVLINDEAFDFGFVKEGDTLPRSAVSGAWLVSNVTRRDGALRLTVLLPHGPNAPKETLFPAPIMMSKDGAVALPPYDAPEEMA